MSDFSRKTVSQAAYIFATEDLCSTAGGQYDDFLEFLIAETDQRPVLSHYFACLFKDNEEKASEKLKLFLYTVLTDKAKMGLLNDYVEDCRDALERDDAREIFDRYDEVKSLKGEDRREALDAWLD